MQSINDVHEQFSEFFRGKKLKPFAYWVSKKLSEGHICLDLEEAIDNDLLVPLRYPSAEEAGRDLLNEELVGGRLSDNQPFILYNGRLYLHRYFVYETMVLERIRKLIEEEAGEKEERLALIREHADYIKELFHSSEDKSGLLGEERTDWQLVAVVLGILNNFTMITGGPGTGKTTTVSKLLKVLKKISPTLKIGLAAPTGKAAMRLAESLEGETPTTIHRMLKSVYGTNNFRHNQSNPLDFDIVIIDEASMIDVALFAKLLDAIGSRTRVILLGDKDQLASVQAGSLFRDLCLAQESNKLLSPDIAGIINSMIDDASSKVSELSITEHNANFLLNHVVELTRSRRFDSRKGIGKLSKAIISNDLDSVKRMMTNHEDDDEVAIDLNYDRDRFEQFIEGYRSYIQEKDIRQALKKFNHLKVLCAVREGKYGVYSLNNMIEAHLTSLKLIEPKDDAYANKPVIITKNYYDLGLFNGDIGIIRPDDNGRLMVWFEGAEGELQSVLPSLIVESETVYAMTIHKSQGSEYKEVLVILPEDENAQLLTRELLYTAVTRARDKATVFASESTLTTMISRGIKRASGIQGRISKMN